MTSRQTSVKEMAKHIARRLKKENPDYNYLRELFRDVRKNLNIHRGVDNENKKLPYVPTEEEINKYYKVVWESKNMQHVIMIKIFLYTGVRISEIIRIKLSDVDIDKCQIKIDQTLSKKERLVPFPSSFKEVLGIYLENMRKKKAKYLFESTHNKPYSDRGLRKIFMNYTKAAGMEHSISPKTLRHFLFTWMKRKGVEDELLQSYSGIEKKESLEVYSKLTLQDCQPVYEKKIRDFPI